MKNQGYLIIDSGGGSTRVAVVSCLGEMLAFMSITNEFYSDGQCVSFRPSLWLDKILAAAESVCRQAPDCEIIALTSTSAREGIVLKYQRMDRL